MSMLDDHDAEELAFLRDEVKRLRRTLNELTPPLDMLLKRRGFRVYKKEPPDDLLVPGEPFRDGFYTSLHKYSFRLFLRDVIKHQDRFTLEEVTRYSTARVIRTHLNYLGDIRMIKEGATSYTLSHRPITSFGPTLEWYVAELLRREFGAEALWGVKFRRPNVGGDYDVLAKLDGSLLYIAPPSRFMGLPSPLKVLGGSGSFFSRGGSFCVFLPAVPARAWSFLISRFESLFIFLTWLTFAPSLAPS